MKQFSRPPGTHDFLPAEMASRNYVEQVMCATFEEYGFQPIQTPLFEEFGLLSAQAGEEIRQKMFTFVGSDQVDYALRPELTAPVCRLVATEALQHLPYPHKLYYVGQCVRQEPVGQDREFRQAGVELIGSESVLADAEIITIPVKILEKLNISAYNLKIGNTGIFREIFRVVDIHSKDLSEIIGDINHLTQLREECEFLQTLSQTTSIEYIKKELRALRRLQGRAYDGKYEIDRDTLEDLSEDSAQEWLEHLPKVAEEVYQITWKKSLSLTDEICQLCLNVSKIHGSREYVMREWDKLTRETAVQAKQDLTKLCDWLDHFGVTDYTVDLGITRGFDFYTGTVFQIESPLLETQHQICGGGRYDQLIKEFGGPDLAGAGFAFQFERFIEVFEKSQNGNATVEFRKDCYIATTGSELIPKAIELAEMLRAKGKKVEIDLMARALEAQLDYATDMNYDYALILAPDTLQQNEGVLRDLKTETERPAQFVELSDLFAE